ncbi:MAG: GNAT family N-acetyltransferase [Promethearchaeota archaeon]
MILKTHEEKNKNQIINFEILNDYLGLNIPYIRKKSVLTVEKKKDRLYPLALLNSYSIDLRTNYCSKERYKNILDKSKLYWNLLLKDYEFKIYRKDELPAKLLENCEDSEDWYYGYMSKTHYIFNGFNEIIGCLNLIFLSIYNGVYLYYLDTIEIKKNYRRRGLGSKLFQFIIEQEIESYNEFYLFLLVANCEQYKLKFFNTLGFIPVKLRKTKIGTHCIMSYPFDENSEIFCRRMFDYFNWREGKKEFISSDCKFAYNPNPTGLYWCVKKCIYVTGLEKQSCKFYQKEKEIFNEKKFLDFKKILK